jgi:hypothetical protein
MKSLRLVLAVSMLATALVSSAVAKDKKHKPEVCQYDCMPRVYDKEGTVSFHATAADSEAHVTVGSETFDSYCSTRGSSVSCTDSPGAARITFANGYTTVFHPLDRRRSCGGYTGTYANLAPACADPLEALAFGVPIQERSFKYRVTAFPNAELANACRNGVSVPDSCSLQPYYCLQQADPQQEACYRLFSIMSPDMSNSKLWIGLADDANIKVWLESGRFQ